MFHAILYGMQLAMFMYHAWCVCMYVCTYSYKLNNYVQIVHYTIIIAFNFELHMQDINQYAS